METIVKIGVILVELLRQEPLRTDGECMGWLAGLGNANTSRALLSLATGQLPPLLEAAMLRPRSKIAEGNE